MRVKGIAQKWLLNSFGIVLVILIIFIIGIGVLLREYYYGAVQQLLLARSDFVYSNAWSGMHRAAQPALLTETCGIMSFHMPTRRQSN